MRCHVKRGDPTMTVAWMMVACLLLLLGFVAAARAGELESGGQLYQQSCAICHGAEGKGNGPAAAALTPKPTDLTNHDYMKTLTNEQMLKVLKLGGVGIGKSPLMPPTGASLNEQQLKSLVTFMRALHEATSKSGASK